MDAKEEFESIKKEVLNLLQTDPRCRNSDKFLIFRILKNYTNINISFEEFDKCPCFESIRRIRQKIQEEDNNLKADSDVQDNRDKKREEYKQYFKPIDNYRIETEPVIHRVRGIEVKNFIRER